MDLAPLIAKKRERLAELDQLVSSDDFYADPAKARDVMREQARLKELALSSPFHFRWHGRPDPPVHAYWV